MMMRQRQVRQTNPEAKLLGNWSHAVHTARGKDVYNTYPWRLKPTSNNGTEPNKDVNFFSATNG